MIRKEEVLPVFTVTLYCGAIFLNIYFQSHLVAPAGEADLVQKIFGTFRGAIADWSFMKAEEYNHRGLPFMQAVGYHEGRSSLAEEYAEHTGGVGKDEHHHHADRAEKDLFSRIYASVKVTGDSHLNEEEAKEVLPWFYIEVMFDPHDIRGYVLGGFWLERIGRDEEALKFLKEGERYNPRSAQILSAIGSLYYRKNGLDTALDYLERACKLWLEGGEPNAINNKYKRSERFFAFDLLGDIYSKKGEERKALEVYKELYEIDPASVILNKIRRLSV